MISVRLRVAEKAFPGSGQLASPAGFSARDFSTRDFRGAWSRWSPFGHWPVLQPA